MAGSQAQLTAKTDMVPAYTAYCVCPACRADLISEKTALRCVACDEKYPVRNGIPILLPAYGNQRQIQYERCYRAIAEDDLRAPIEPQRDSRHRMLVQFIGDVRGKSVLDIGSSHARYLVELEADVKVALDIATPYLEAASRDGIVRICGDAEYLPVKAGCFDVIIISDILEHLLNPQKLVDVLRAACRSSTRIIVHIPWEERLESYQSAKYEFTHLRSFTAYRFAELWRGFHVKRVKETGPCLEDPIIFALEPRLPRSLYNVLVHAYYETNLSKWDYETRRRWISELPRREWWLLRLYKPMFRIYELKVLRSALWPAMFWKLQKISRKLLYRTCGSHP
jgi:SAM-dependent methyltransferase